MSTDAQPEPIAPKPKRRWLQFGLRTLLGLVALAAVGMGLWVNSAERQRRAVGAVSGLGGQVFYDGDEHISGYGRESDGAALVPVWLQELLGDDYFRSVVAVNLCYTKVSDAHLSCLNGLTRLEVLNLNGTRVSDAGLVNLRKLTRLRVLKLDGVQLTDRGLRYLTGLTQLQYLAMQNSQITDAGLAHLKGLTHLECLDVSGTKVSDAGIAKLQRALPNCETSTDRW